jgi:isocitrate dehydrogenase
MQPIVIGRHAYDEEDPRAGQGQRHSICTSSGRAAAMAMHNTQQRIEGFARASFNHALQCRRPLYVSTKNTIRKAYDG